MEINSPNNINLSLLVPFPSEIPFMNDGILYPEPLSNNAFVIFRVRDKPNKIKTIIEVNFDIYHNRFPDREISFLSIGDNARVINSNNNPNFISSYYYYPYDQLGEVELYDVYIISKANLGLNYINTIDQYIPTTKNTYVDKFPKEPRTWFAQFDPNFSLNTDTANLVTDGQFNESYLDLPPDTFIFNNIVTQIPQGKVRSLSTPINSNTYYELSNFDNFNQTLFGDILTLNIFTTPPTIGTTSTLLEGRPEKYLKIQANNNNITQLWTYRDVAFLFKPFFKFNNENFIISFCAINNNPDIAPIVPITLGYERFYGADAIIEGRTNFPNISPIELTSHWQKFSISLTLLTSETILQNGEDTYVKILFRLPTSVNFSTFDISFTNIFIDYGTKEVQYPLVSQSNIEYTVDNNVRPIFSTSIGNIPFASRAGEIKQFIHSNDTETTILANGRIIYPDDVHSYIAKNPINGKNVTFSIPYSNSYKTGLYNLIGYQYGTGNDHFTCDSLHNLTWEADAIESTFDNIFYWNYSMFQPSANFTAGFGDGSVIEAIELNRGQTIDDALTVKSFFKKDANNKIWYSANQTNYLNEGIANGLDALLFKNYESNVTYSTHTVPGPINPRTIIGRNQIGSSSNTYDITFPVEDYAINNASPTTILNRSFVSSNNYGLIDCEKVGISEFYEYEIPPYYYRARTNKNLVPANIDGLTLINAKIKGVTYFTNDDSTGRDLNAMNLPIVRIKHEAGGFPATNPNFIVKPIEAIPGQNIADNFAFNTTVIPTYSLDPLYNWQVAAGTQTSIKKIVLSLAMQGKAVFGIKLKSNVIEDFYGKWFIAESKATRTLKEIRYSNNIPTVENITIDDKKFCFYLSNGSTPQPVDPLITSGTKFIPIIFNNKVTKIQISQAIEKTINSYRVQIPNYQGVVLKSYGNSIFDIPNLDGNNNLAFCNNFRNEGFGCPKMEQERQFDLSPEALIFGTGSTTFSSFPVSKVINSENYMYVYNHISVN
ncbi:hypothetical protein UFOVP495_22 [uncultured Caudovirales phage]|uniref:Uncharacterized protein n=1 Tax=uncultured Caudovirales phage TaxID=2100421 RepID=A0A6J5MN30_9CAUD|nr:hypothetical protein UFOVP495_22 [uncultured Caudovirales phage]